MVAALSQRPARQAGAEPQVAVVVAALLSLAEEAGAQAQRPWAQVQRQVQPSPEQLARQEQQAAGCRRTASRDQRPCPLLHSRSQLR